MKLTGIRELTIPLNSEMRNAVISFTEMSASLVIIETDQTRDGEPVVGYGYTGPGRYGQAGSLRERFIPRLLKAAPEDLIDEAGRFDPRRMQAVALAGEKPGGHGDRAVALSALDLAAWDLVGKLEGTSVATILAQRSGGTGQPAAVPVYAAGGYYYDEADDGHERLRRELAGYVAEGYSSVKMKIGGAPLEEDVARMEAALDEIGPDVKLAVDANAAFDVPTAVRYAEALSRLPIAWYEEPVRPLDLAGLKTVINACEGPVATGENLFSDEEVELLLRFGGLRPGHDKIQVDAGLAYGISGFLRIMETAERLEFGPEDFVPHGGHLGNFAVASGLRLGGAEAYPGLFRPVSGSGGAARIEAGLATPQQILGLGVEHHPELLEAFAAIRD